jgi:hypothetical protein
MLRNPEATENEQLAARVIAAPTSNSVEKVLTQQTPLYDVDTAYMLTTNRSTSKSEKSKHQRPVRLASTAMMPIRESKNSWTGKNKPDDSHPLTRTTPKQRQQAIFQHDRKAAQLRYYPEDPEPDPDLIFGLDPLDYPSLREVLFGEANQHAAWKARHSTLLQASENEGRADIPRIHKAYADKYRLPIVLFPKEEGVFRRKCCKDALCKGHTLAVAIGAPSRGYTLVEFLFPGEEARLLSAMVNGDKTLLDDWMASERRPCIECLLSQWTDEYLMYQHDGISPPHPINMFQVIVGPGEYSREVMLPTEIYSVPTGIEGHVPAYDLCHREFELLKPGNVHVIREVEVDFQSRLSQINAWLGVAKTRPLAGAQGKRMLSLASVVDRNVSDPTTADSTVGKVLWRHYKRMLPVMMMADRALIQRDCVESETLQVQTTTRVPAIWLRQIVLALYGFTTANFEFTYPMKTVLQFHIPKNIRRDLCALFEVESLDSTLAHLVSITFCPFEVTMDWLIGIQQTGHLVPVLLTGVLRLLFDTSNLPMGLRHLLRHGEILARPPPDSGWTPANPLYNKGSWLLYTAVVFRCATAYMFDAYIRPCHAHPNGVSRDLEFAEHTTFFADTHLDFLTRFSISPTEDDRFYLRARGDMEPRLSRLYPQMTRVCCFQELPSLSPLLFGMNQWRDPQNKRANASERDTLIRSFRKTFPSVCQMRSANNIYKNAMVQWPNIHKLWVQLMRCFWLGNYPQARNRPPLGVRVKINATFAPVSAIFDQSSPELETSRAKEIQEWTRTHPVLMLAILREYSMSAIEATGSLDMARSRSVRWLRFKQVVRMSHGVLRSALTQMVKKTGNIEWDVLEKRVGDSSEGEVMKWHEKAKTHNIKLHKDTDFGIMLKKMKHVDSKLPIDTGEMRAWMLSQNRLEYTKVIAWMTAQLIHQPLTNGKLRTGLLTGMLKCLGMSERAYIRLRERLHMSVDYHNSDNSFCDFMITLYKDNWHDYVLLKFYLLCVSYYTSDGLRFTSIQHMRNQVNAVRHSLAVPGLKATPNGLGVGNFCENCKKWAHPIVQPSNVYLGYPIVQEDTTKTKKQTTRHKKKSAQEKPYPHDPRPLTLADGRAAGSERLVYNPADCTLYCKRGNVNQTQREFRGIGNILGLDDVGLSVSTIEDESEEDEEDDEDDDEDDEMPIPTKSKTSRKKVANKDCVLQLFKEQFSCKNPLVGVDLLGVYKQLGGVLYTRCVYCGVICEVISANMTNAGVSCGEHALVDEYPDWHPIWKQIVRPTSTIRDIKHPDWIKAYPMATFHRPCIKCHYVDPTGPVTLWVYDGLYKMAKVVLCKHHATPFKSLKHIPLALDWLKGHLGAMSS